MNRTATALLAALDALIAVATGIGICLVPLTLVWAIGFGMGPDWALFWRASADIWLVGHGVDLVVRIPADIAASTGIAGVGTAFSITIAALGFAVLTAMFGARVGRRSAIGGFRAAGILSATLVFGVSAWLLTLSAASDVAAPEAAQGVLLPSLIYFGAAVVGSERAMQALPDSRRDRPSRSIRTRMGDLPVAVGDGLSAAFRGAGIAVAGLLGVAAVLVALCLVIHYATVTGLYESLQAGALGGAALTVLQLALLPNAVVWSASWLIGPGFAVGAGSSVSPAGATLGSLPGLPLFGAIPQSDAIGFLGVLIPIALGGLAGWAVRDRIGSASLLERSATGAGIGVASGVALGLAAWWSAGAVGPGRLAHVGPDPLLVGAIAAVEIAIPAIIVLLAAPSARRASPSARSSASETDRVDA